MKFSIEPPGACADEDTYLSIKHELAVEILDNAEDYKSQGACDFLIDAVKSGELDAHRLPKDFFPRLFKLLARIEATPKTRNAQRDDWLWSTYTLCRGKMFGNPMTVETLYQMLAEEFGISEDSVDKIVKSKKREMRKGDKRI